MVARQRRRTGGDRPSAGEARLSRVSGPPFHQQVRPIAGFGAAVRLGPRQHALDWGIAGARIAKPQQELANPFALGVQLPGRDGAFGPLATSVQVDLTLVPHGDGARPPPVDVSIGQERRSRDLGPLAAGQLAMEELVEVEPMRQALDRCRRDAEPDHEALGVRAEVAAKAKITAPLQHGVEVHLRMHHAMSPGAHEDDQAAGPGKGDDLAQQVIDALQRLQERVTAAKNVRRGPVAGVGWIVERPEGVQQLAIEMQGEHAKLPAAVAEHGDGGPASHGQHLERMISELPLAPGRVRRAEGHPVALGRQHVADLGGKREPVTDALVPRHHEAVHRFERRRRRDIEETDAHSARGQELVEARAAQRARIDGHPIVRARPEGERVEQACRARIAAAQQCRERLRCSGLEWPGQSAPGTSIQETGEGRQGRAAGEEKFQGRAGHLEHEDPFVHASPSDADWGAGRGVPPRLQHLAIEPLDLRGALLAGVEPAHALGRGLAEAPGERGVVEQATHGALRARPDPRTGPAGRSPHDPPRPRSRSPWCRRTGTPMAIASRNTSPKPSSRDGSTNTSIAA